MKEEGKSKKIRKRRRRGEVEGEEGGGKINWTN